MAIARSSNRIPLHCRAVTTAIPYDPPCPRIGRPPCVILQIVGARNRAWLLILLIAAICAASVWGIVWYRGRPLTTAALLKRIPDANPLVLYVDFETLRRSGFLEKFAAAKAEEDPDYQLFVRKTNF